MFYIIYLDNILIFSKNPKEHQKHLELVIERLYHIDLYANPQKYEFLKPKLEYLRFLINKDGIRIYPARIETI